MTQKERDKKFKEVIEAIESGLSAKAACKELNIPISTFGDWKRKEGNSALYARAREARADVLAEEIIEIADSAPKTIDSEYGDKVDTGDIQQKRLMVDARKWAASKMNPKKYGDSQQIKLAGNEGQELKAIFATDMIIKPMSEDSENQ